MPWWRYLLAFGLKTLTSKSVIWLVCQKPLAQVSKRTSFPVRVHNWRVSPFSCCNWGSTRISLHTSFNSLAVIFRIWLWRIEIKPPFLHGRACCRSNLAPHSELVGNLRRGQQYLIQIRSKNSCVVKLQPLSGICNVVNQLDARSSWFGSSKRHWLYFLIEAVIDGK